MPNLTPRRVTVSHEYYPCDCGCCGHAVFVDNVKAKFYFEHPSGNDSRQFAERLIRATLGDDAVKDLDWANSEVLDD